MYICNRCNSSSSNSSSSSIQTFLAMLVDTTVSVIERQNFDFIRVKQKKPVDIFAYITDETGSAHFSENLPAYIKLNK